MLIIYNFHFHNTHINTCIILKYTSLVLQLIRLHLLSKIIYFLQCSTYVLNIMNLYSQSIITNINEIVFRDIKQVKNKIFCSLIYDNEN